MFEIDLPHRGVTEGQALVDSVTGIKMAQEERANGVPMSTNIGIRLWDREKAYRLAHGEIFVCHELTLPWPSLTDDEKVLCRNAFIRLWLELECRYPDHPVDGYPVTRVGNYNLARLEYEVGPKWLHAVVSTAELAA